MYGALALSFHEKEASVLCDWCGKTWNKQKYGWPTMGWCWEPWPFFSRSLYLFVYVPHTHTQLFLYIMLDHRKAFNTTWLGRRVFHYQQLTVKWRRAVERGLHWIHCPLKDLCSFIQELCCLWAMSSSRLQCWTNLLHDDREKVSGNFKDNTQQKKWASLIELQMRLSTQHSSKNVSCSMKRVSSVQVDSTKGLMLYITH